MKALKTKNVLLIASVSIAMAGVLLANRPANARPIEGAFLGPHAQATNATTTATTTAPVTNTTATWQTAWQSALQGWKVKVIKSASTWESKLQHNWTAWRASTAQTTARTTAQSTSPTAQTSSTVQTRTTAAISAAPAATATNAPAKPTLTPAQKEFSQIIKQTHQAAKQAGLNVVTPARAGTSELPKTKSGVPVFAFRKVVHKRHKRVVIEVKKIPRLDIGVEKSISATALIPTNLVVALSPKEIIKELPAPPMPSMRETQKMTSRKLAHVQTAKSPQRGGLQIGQMVTEKRIDAVVLNPQPANSLAALKPINALSPDQLLMLAAAIYFQKGNKCHIVSGLLTDLVTMRQFSEEANYDLGICAYKMGFHTEEVSRLIKVVQKADPDYAPSAIAALVDRLPREYDDEVAPVLQNLRDRKLIPSSAEDNVHYVLARYAHENGDYRMAADEAQKVSEKSPLYASAQYLLAIGLYGAKRTQAAEKVLFSLRTWMNSHGDNDANIKGLIAMNLGRMEFMQGHYQKAEQEYMQVPKSSPLWIQALIEQGWSQLNLGDSNGAIGNMYSLQSPFFKLVYKPESWVIRTIGYVDICQYGDAYHALTIMEQKYRGMQKQVESYMTNHTGALSYYNTIKTYVRGPSERNVDGLPYPVIREIAHRRPFLNDQNAINDLVNETNQYSYVYQILRKDQTGLTFRTNRTKGRILKLKREIAAVNKNPQYMQYLNEWLAEEQLEQRLLDQQEFEGQLYEKARQGYLKMQSVAIARVQKKQTSLVGEAGDRLMAELKTVDRHLSQIFSGNEFLRYEIFAGSGENIRYQVNGGTIQRTDRIPASVKPQKELKWHFDGEYWADEIGSYRSMLQNDCPKN